MLGKIIDILFRIFLIILVIYLVRMIYLWFRWNFTFEDIFYFIMIGFVGWIILTWFRDSA